VPIVDQLLPEYEREMALTRRLLERLPAARLSWSPHPRSMSLGALASHVVELADWQDVISRPAFDVSAASMPPPSASPAEALDRFDRHVAGTRRALDGRTDGELLDIWSVTRGDDTLLTMPKVTMLRAVLLNHLIHHRGQLTVYLRLNGVPLPSIYGPSADEGAS